MNATIPMKDHKIIVEKARRDAYHEGYKQGRFDEFIESQYGIEDHDIIPVIRCKDCQHWMKNPYRESSVFGLCFKHKDIAIATDETDWCSWAERKEE